MNTIIEFKAVDILQKTNIIFQNINFKISAGEFIYIIGKTGSGKSSLLKSLYTELPIKKGSIKVLGCEVGELDDNNISELRNRIEKINPYLTVENYVINGCLSNIGDPDLKISNHDINPIDINYYMTCPISRFSETMAKCSMQSKKNGKKN